MRPTTPIAVVLGCAAIVALSSCGSSDAGGEGGGPEQSQAVSTGDVAWQPVSTEPPPFVEGSVGYELPNGRVLWVDEGSGVGRIIADPDETNADDWTCDALVEDLGGVEEFYEITDDIPNFEGVVCHPASVNEDLGR